jgi:acyl-CoA thioesterase
MNRLPVGEWVLVDAKTWLERHGTGLAEGALYDTEGRVGRSIQGLLVERRE